jgi:hypothetical protein
MSCQECVGSAGEALGSGPVSYMMRLVNGRQPSVSVVACVRGVMACNSETLSYENRNFGGWSLCSSPPLFPSFFLKNWKYTIKPAATGQTIGAADTRWQRTQTVRVKDHGNRTCSSGNCGGCERVCLQRCAPIVRSSARMISAMISLLVMTRRCIAVRIRRLRPMFWSACTHKLNRKRQGRESHVTSEGSSRRSQAQWATKKPDNAASRDILLHSACALAT